MPEFKTADRVKETTTTTGTGTLNLDGAETNFRTFVSAIGDTNTCNYAIIDDTNNDWEIGIGTVTDASPDTLSRDTVIASSNADALVNFGSGTKIVICTISERTIGNTVSFTPTGSWTGNTTYTGWYRQVGDHLEIRYNVALSGDPTPAATSLKLDMPSGFTIDQQKMSPNRTVVGVGLLFGAGSTIFGALVAVYIPGSDVDSFFIQYEDNDRAVLADLEFLTSDTFTWINGDYVTITLSIPIE